MGRCDQNEILLNDGIVVVPDSAAAHEVPPVPGLLEYRKDTKKLYVRSNETWNVIGQGNKENNAEMMKPRLEQVEKRLNIKFAKLEKNLAELKIQLGRVNKTVNADHTKDLVQPTTRKPIWTTAKPVTSCSSLYKSGRRRDGVYIINPDGLGSFQVKCDMQTDGGGWTVFQRRQDASVDFYRGWQDYKNGFGDLNGNFWLGLNRIHRLTKSGQNVLRVDLMDWTSNTAYAEYRSFSVASESDGYRLDLGNFSGSAGDSLEWHNGMKFTTYDRDNDQYRLLNCAVDRHGAWWYNHCYHSNLNGRYLKAGEGSSKGTNWYFWKYYKSMKKTEMKVRPTGF